MEKWTSVELREEFLSFFKEKGHKIIPSSSLTNSGDPSVLLTTAGMQQLKPYYLDAARADTDFGVRRVASSQKCFRTTDIDEVGDQTHLTFFEMLGNFAFGDYLEQSEKQGSYFKKEAIEFAFELLTARYNLPVLNMHVTVFKGDAEVPRDEESVKIWETLGFSEKKRNLIFAGREDNFWGPTGEKGPCGPTTEIYLNGVEIWNIVFNEFYCNKDKTFTLLSFKGIDTGMGLERLARVANNAPTVFETDLFAPLIEIIKKQSAQDNLPEETRIKAERVVADHIRGATFLIAEGLTPSNVKAGYVLRRVLRRAIRFGHTLRLPHECFGNIIKTTGRIYKDIYPELFKNSKQIIQVFEKEYQLFGKTLKKGMNVFEKEVLGATNVFSGEKAFFLYATYGFPIELIQEMLKERNLQLHIKEFEKALEAHRELSKEKK